MNTSDEYGFEIAWREIVIAKLERVLAPLNKVAKLEQMDAAARQNEIRRAYSTPEEAQDAYGYGYITEDEYQEFLSEMEHKDAPTMTSAARDYIKEQLARLRREIKDFRWMALPEAEREAIKARNKRYREELHKIARGEPMA